VNRIFFNGPGGRGAGLGDRRWIIDDLAGLAGYLCAELVLSRPFVLLNEEHNNGKHLSHDLQWKDLFTLKFAEDDKPVIVENEDNVNGGYPGYQRIISRGRNWKAGFKTAQDHSWAQEEAWRQGDLNAPGFVWELIYTNAYANDLTGSALPLLTPDLQEKLGHHYNPDVMKPLLHLNTVRGEKLVGCQYAETKNEPSQEIKMIRDLIIERIQDHSPNATFGKLHLRRGDAINECDTHIVKVKKYLSCSLEDTEEKGHLTILLSSDEQDDTYRQNILDLANDYEHVTMMDLDKITSQVIKEAVEVGKLESKFENNYFEYDLESRMNRIFKFKLARHRAFECADCNPVVDML